jgi:hypothetical protein
LIVATGPISSGTRLLTNIVGKLVVDEPVVHRSMPQWTVFWDYADDPEGTRYVIILRRPDISVRSAHKQGHGDPEKRGWRHLDHRMTQVELNAWWVKAIIRLSHIPNAGWFSYEALIADPFVQVGSIAHWLGVPCPPDILSRIPRIEDRNAKYR